VQIPTSGKTQPRCERAYHVDWNEAADVWDVLDEEGRVLGHCADEAEATDIAIRQAHQDHGAGDDVIVCVQEKDGGSRRLDVASHQNGIVRNRTILTLAAWKGRA
jgi:hypothetical protein